MGADLADHFGGKTCAGHQVATVNIGAQIGLIPEELIDQVAVGAVQLQAIEAKFTGRAGSLAECENDLLDLPRGHCSTGLLARIPDTGGPESVGAVLAFAHWGDADVPELGKDPSAGLVDFSRDPPPTFQGRPTVKMRNRSIGTG